MLLILELCNPLLGLINYNTFLLTLVAFTYRKFEKFTWEPGRWLQVFYVFVCLFVFNLFRDSYSCCRVDENWECLNNFMLLLTLQRNYVDICIVFVLVTTDIYLSIILIIGNRYHCANELWINVAVFPVVLSLTFSLNTSWRAHICSNDFINILTFACALHL